MSTPLWLWDIAWMRRPWAKSPSSCLQSFKDSSKFSCIEHWEERIWLWSVQLLYNYSQIYVPEWWLQTPNPSMGRHLRMRISSWSTGSWNLVHGKCWIQHKWFPFFNLHCQEWMVGWWVYGFWQGERKPEYCWSHKMLLIQEWQDQQEDHHIQLWANLINLTRVLF